MSARIAAQSMTLRYLSSWAFNVCMFVGFGLCFLLFVLNLFFCCVLFGWFWGFFWWVLIFTSFDLTGKAANSGQE